MAKNEPKLTVPELLYESINANNPKNVALIPNPNATPLPKDGTTFIISLSFILYSLIVYPFVHRCFLSSIQYEVTYLKLFIIQAFILFNCKY